MFGKALFLAFSALLMLQVCRADTADDAEDALAEYRLTTNKSLNDAFVKHVEMATDVDTAALDTKDAGTKAVKVKIASVDADCEDVIQKRAAEDLDECISKHADMALEHLSESSTKLAGDILRSGYDKDLNIIYCGRADTDCLDEVIDNIKKETEEAPDMIEEVLEKDREVVDDHIEMIKACADEADSSVKKYAASCGV